MYVKEDKSLVHEDGWAYYVRDGEDEGLLEIGYREWNQEKRVYENKGEPLVICDEYAGKLADILLQFARREKAD